MVVSEGILVDILSSIEFTRQLMSITHSCASLFTMGKGQAGVSKDLGQANKLC